MRKFSKILIVTLLIGITVPTFSHALTLGEYIGAGSGTTKLLLHLNGNSTDSSGNGNNGTDTSVTYGLGYGKFGQGAGFNGSSSNIKCGTTGIPTGAGARTLATWMRFDSLPSTSGQQYGIIHYGDNNTRLLFGFNIDFGTTPSNGIALVTYADDLISSFIPSINTWYRVVGTYDGNVTLKIYVNGQIYGTRTLSGALNTTMTVNGVVLGASLAGGDTLVNFFPGKLDETIIENRVWSDSEARKDYTYAKGRFGII